MTDINRLKNEARRYEQREQWPQAIELYSKAIDAIEELGYGTDLSLYNRVGDLYLRQGDTARAVSFYERAVDRYAEQGLQTSAVALCNKVLRIAPGRSEIFRILGRLHAETGLQSQARRSFLEYASRMEKAGELGAAVEALDEFVKLSADEEARITLGRYLIEQDRIPEALPHLRQVLAERTQRGEESGEIEALIEQVAPGEIEVAIEQVAPDETEPDMEQAAPDDAEPVIDQALADETEPAINQALPDETEPAPVLSDLAAAELDQIIADLAEPDLGELDLDDQSDDDQSENFLAAAETPHTLDDPEPETLGASITVQDSTLHDLLNEFQEKVVATVEDTDSAIHFDLGIAYREMGLLDDAIREFTTAIQNDHRLLGAHQQLTESLIQQGQYEAGAGAMAEYVRAVGPENDVSDQMDRMTELLRASPSDETLDELKQLLRSIADPASGATNGAAGVDALGEIDVDELFPDLEEAWETTTDEEGLEELEDTEETESVEGSPDHDVEAIETETSLAEQTEVPGEAESEFEAAASQVETEDAASASLETGWNPEAATLEASGESETSFEVIDEPEGEIPEMTEEGEPELDEDQDALAALSEALGEPPDAWSDPDEFQSTWDPDAALEDVAEAEDDWEPEASWEAEIELETEVTDEDVPEIELETEVTDEEVPEIELEAGVPDEEVPEIETEDLGGLLFGARLAKFRARMARSASETDFQAHYDLGLAYKEVALFDEAIAELLVAITGPDALARKSLRLMSEVAGLADDESLHITTSEHLADHGMNAEALEHLSRAYDQRQAGDGDTDDVLRRMTAIDPMYVPASAPPAQPIDAEPQDMALVSGDFDSILDELNTDVDAPIETEAEEDELSAWELRTAELLEEGHRDEAIRELYRLKSAYEDKDDVAGAMRAVNNLLLLDPENVILHHQQVEYAIVLDDPAALTNANLELGRCLRRQGALSNARSAFESVLEVDSDHQAAQDAIAEIEREEAEEEALTAALDDNDPVHYETHFELGVAFKQDGLHEEAVYELEIAARGLDNPARAYELLGELFNEAGQHDTTSRVLGRALDANHSDDSELIGVLYQLGISHQMLGETDQAADYFRRVLEVDSDYREAAHRLDQCSL